MSLGRIAKDQAQKMLEVCKDPKIIVRRRHASHITVAFSKAAHSGPSVCLRARALCPLRVSCPGADRAFVHAESLQAKTCSASCRSLALPCPLGYKTEIKTIDAPSVITSSETCVCSTARLATRPHAYLSLREVGHCSSNTLVR
jgi:hypothetical protein